MTDSKFAAENYAYRKGDNITSIDKQLRSIKIGAGYEEKIGLSKIGILYEINTEGFNVRNPKVTNYLQGHYNNGYSGHEWISEYIHLKNTI